MKMIETEHITASLMGQLLNVWESSVRQTHLFLSGSEIDRIKKYVPDAIGKVEHLLLSVNEAQKPLAFLGCSKRRIEMLFVDASHRGCGIGKQLIAKAIKQYGVTEVTVNEQNPLAVGFYEHIGFSTFKRSEADEEGNPYPLLYMSLNQEK